MTDVPAPPVQQAPPPKDDPKPTQVAPKVEEIAPAPKPEAPPRQPVEPPQRAVEPEAKPAEPETRPVEPTRPDRSPEVLREASEIRALLQRLADAVSSDRPRERVAALGPGAVMMGMRGMQQMQDAFGDPIEARLGRIEHIATRPDAVDVRFFLLVSGSTRQQPAPLAFTATISRGESERKFLELRRDFQQGREGRGRGGRDN